MSLPPLVPNHNPRTGKGWEIDGLTPDIAATSEQALDAALKDFAAKAR
jgi:hypothetical protein